MSESIAGETENVVAMPENIFQLPSNPFLLIIKAVCFRQTIRSVIATMRGVKINIVQTSETTVMVAQTARQIAVIFTVS
jgi:hypothetical protein